MKFAKMFFMFAAVFVFTVFIGSLSHAASTETALKPVPINFGHDRCKRCFMLIRSPRYSAEVGNMQSGKIYKFDDIGCAVMWLYKDCHFAWYKSAKIWVSDAKTGKWLNAKTACWVDGEITPMHFGFGAYKRGEINKTCLNWKTVKKLILKRGIKKENRMKKFVPKKWEIKVKKMCILN